MFERSRHARLDRDVETVWAALAAFDQLDRWFAPCTHCEYTTVAREGPGVARRVQVGPAAVVETVRDWDPGKRLAYTVSGTPAFIEELANAIVILLDL